MCKHIYKYVNIYIYMYVYITNMSTVDNNIAYLTSQGIYMNIYIYALYVYHIYTYMYI
jgi:hypothetical protein